jgi:protein phosphatase
MAAQEAGVAYVVQGNHDRKLSRWLEGRKVTVGHGLQESIDQLAEEPAEFRERVKTFLADLRSHYWLDGGKLAVAHAGLKEEMIGRGSPAVREFALFGETRPFGSIWFGPIGARSRWFRAARREDPIAWT